MSMLLLLKDVEVSSVIPKGLMGKSLLFREGLQSHGTPVCSRAEKEGFPQEERPVFIFGIDRNRRERQEGRDNKEIANKRQNADIHKCFFTDILDKKIVVLRSDRRFVFNVSDYVRPSKCYCDVIAG